MEGRVKAGGQAVIEGVMMRSGEQMAVAVRSPDGSISVHREIVYPLAKRYPLLAWPVIRGAVSLIESLQMGIRALMFSANAQAGSAEEKLSPTEMAATLALALGAAVLLFILLPTFLTSLAGRYIARGILLNAVEGLIRLAVVTGYIAGIALIPDIVRVLEYHGAEHKVINALESPDSVTVAAAREQSTAHVRCGTSFILMVAVVSVVIFSFFGWPSIWGRVGIRLLMLPVVAGVAYEMIMLAARSQSGVVRLLAAPGLWLQRLTTREPDDGQLEVAIAALRGCLEGDEDGVKCDQL
ncbi:MAG: DUF1385 domain-containing protein [Bacillota bacterium]